jgi:hypothetical protein
VDRKDPLDALELNHNLSFDDGIHSVTALQQDPPVTDRQRNLSLELDLAQSEFMRQAFLVCRFQ